MGNIEHMFMLADSFHGQLERSIHAKKNVYDFEDFMNIIKKNGTIIEIQASDFIQRENASSSAKFANKPILNTAQEVHFHRGHTELYWKLSLDDEDYQYGQFVEKGVYIISSGKVYTKIM